MAYLSTQHRPRGLAALPLIGFIARDIARSHGGEIFLGVSPLGGLRASVRVPV